MSGPAAAAIPVFERVAANLALYALSSRGEAAMPGYWAGYRPGPNLSLDPTLTLDAVWRNVGGVYLFCGSAPADAQGFLTVLDAWLAANSPRGEVRFLWVSDPGAPSGSWVHARVEAELVPGSVWQVSREAAFTAGGHSVTLAAGTSLIQRVAPQPGIWLYEDGRLRLRAPGADYWARVTKSQLPLAGPGLGAWTFEFVAGGEGNPDLSGIGTQLRFTAPEPSAHHSRGVRYGPGRGPGPGRGLRTVAMPLLVPGAPAVLCQLSFDPLFRLSPARTAITLGPAAGVSPPPLRSYLRTPLGHEVTLYPQGADSPWPARLVFNHGPAGGSDLYLTPDGAFLMQAPSADLRLALGLSGLEYAAIPDAGTCRFAAGHAAFAGDDGVLTAEATTAYLDLLPAGPGRPALAYYAQPRAAPWFAAGNADTAGFLAAQPVPAGALPGWPAAPDAAGKVLPVGCYAGTAVVDSAAAAWLEEAALAPARQREIGGAAPAGPTYEVVTPDGMLATVAAGGAGWDKIVLAAFPGADIPELALTAVSPVMRGALAASELFMVVADTGMLLDQGHASVRYRLTQADLIQLRMTGVPPQVVTALTSILEPEGYPTFETEKKFLDRIGPVVGDYRDQILRVAGQLKMTLDDWTFQLSPRSWRTGTEAPTIMLVKSCARALADLVAEPAAWTWREAAGNVAETQAVLAGVIEAAAAAPAGSPDARFYREVATDPRWSGVLFINAPIVAAELPDDLRFVTAGIDVDNFYAHHVGFGYTPFTTSGRTVTFGRSAAFGLIRYVDETELAPRTTVPFAFVTQRLEVRFANSAIADLSARVQLVVNELFGSRLTRLEPVGGNSLTLSGSYQRQEGAPCYQFTLDRGAVYLTEAAALESVEVLGVAVRTLRAGAEDPGVTAEFSLGGNLRFTSLPHFDLFSYGPQPAAPLGQKPADGYLRFDDLAVTMTFPVADPSSQTFSVSEGLLRIDLASSKPRLGSLAAAFPVAVTGVVAVPAEEGGTRQPLGFGPIVRSERSSAAHGNPAAGDTGDGLRPEDLGYVSVLAPIDQVPLKPPWYGLMMRLDLGSLGPLADGTGLAVTLLAGWMPGTAPGEKPVYCGLKLATPGAIDADWPVQGVVRVGFRGFEFLVDDSGDVPAYILRLQRLALSVLGWSFPPGQTNVLVFGDPNARQATSVAWYGAYEGELRQ